MGTAGLGLSPEFFVNGAEDTVDDKACEGGGERVSLGEAVFLNEEVKGTVGPVEKTAVRVLVHQIEIVDERMEAWVGLKDVKGFFA
jgi:hypothetical protein